jgi:hypothetical protein
MIIAMDADTFELESGRTNFEIAQNIANVAQQSGSKGLSQMINQNRFFLINDMLSPLMLSNSNQLSNIIKVLDMMQNEILNRLKNEKAYT